MVWLLIAIGVAAAAVLSLLVVDRSRNHSGSNAAVDDIDPLFVAGIALTGAGVALAVSVTDAMYVLMIVGLVVMAVGAMRTRRAER